MTAIVYGANGQDGHYLINYLESLGIRCVGVSRSGPYLRSDVSDFESVLSLIRTHEPDYIFHLAAESTTRHDAWQQNHKTISTGTFNILEAVYKMHAPIKVFLAGSGLQFINDERPIKETDSFAASSPYAVSRIHSAFAARYYRDLGVKAYFGYLYNHDSPRRSKRHVAAKIVLAAKEIAKGGSEVLEIGDPTVKKEWGYSADIVRGMYTLVQQDEIYEANIGTGQAYSIAEWLDVCFTLVGRNWRDHVIVNNDFRSEYRVLVSDPSVINTLGWKPEVSFTQLAELMMKEMYE